MQFSPSFIQTILLGAIQTDLCLRMFSAPHYWRFYLMWMFIANREAILHENKFSAKEGKRNFFMQFFSNLNI